MVPLSPLYFSLPITSHLLNRTIAMLSAKPPPAKHQQSPAAKASTDGRTNDISRMTASSTVPAFQNHACPVPGTAKTQVWVGENATDAVDWKADHLPLANWPATPVHAKL